MSRKEKLKSFWPIRILVLVLMGGLAGCANDSSSPGTLRLANSGLYVRQKSEVTMQVDTEGKSYTLKWVESGRSYRAIVSILIEGGLDPSGINEFISAYVANARQNAKSFTLVSDTGSKSRPRTVTFSLSLDERISAEMTILLMFGKKVVEVLLPHPGEVTASAIQTELSSMIEGV